MKLLEICVIRRFMHRFSGGEVVVSRSIKKKESELQKALKDAQINLTEINTLFESIKGKEKTCASITRAQEAKDDINYGGGDGESYGGGEY